MATIDERAEEFGKQGCGENCIFICEEWKDKNGVCSRLASRAALYKSIATEQRAKDIDKACEWIEERKHPVLASDTDDTIVGYDVSAIDLLEWLKSINELQEKTIQSTTF